jgi:LysR family hydrogen peroxide-inducible transcriptional activator
MDIHHIRYFLAVCETLNFTAAAQRCNVAQPALSRAVQQLEEEVGGLLIRRERTGNSLTELGLLMRPRFQNILAELGEVKQQARRFLTLEKANLNIGVMCTVGPTRFAGMLAHFSHTEPGISLNISEGVPATLTAKLHRGEIELALMALPGGFHKELEAEVIYRERFVVAFPIGHRFMNMNAVPMAAIRGETYLRRLNCEYWQYLSDLTDERGADVHLGHASEREDWIQNMVAAGLGICFIPEFSALISGVQTRPVVEPEVWRDVCLVRRAGRQPSRAAGRFLEALRDFPFPESRFASDVPDRAAV